MVNPGVRDKYQIDLISRSRSPSSSPTTPPMTASLEKSGLPLESNSSSSSSPSTPSPPIGNMPQDLKQNPFGVDTRRLAETENTSSGIGTASSHSSTSPSSQTPPTPSHKVTSEVPSPSLSQPPKAADSYIIHKSNCNNKTDSPSLLLEAAAISRSAKTDSSSLSTGTLPLEQFASHGRPLRPIFNPYNAYYANLARFGVLDYAVLSQILNQSSQHHPQGSNLTLRQNLEFPLVASNADLYRQVQSASSPQPVVPYRLNHSHSQEDRKQPLHQLDDQPRKRHCSDVSVIRPNPQQPQQQHVTSQSIFLCPSPNTYQQQHPPSHYQNLSYPLQLSSLGPHFYSTNGLISNATPCNEQPLTSCVSYSSGATTPTGSRKTSGEYSACDSDSGFSMSSKSTAKTKKTCQTPRENKTREPKCEKCKWHGDLVILKGHNRRRCPHNTPHPDELGEVKDEPNYAGPCRPCRLIDEKRKVMALQVAKKREMQQDVASGEIVIIDGTRTYMCPETRVQKNILTLLNEERSRALASGLSESQTLKERLDEFVDDLLKKMPHPPASHLETLIKGKPPKCTKCQNHSIIFDKKDHGKQCPWKECNCTDKACTLLNQRKKIMNQLKRYKPYMERRYGVHFEDDSASTCSSISCGSRSSAAAKSGSIKSPDTFSMYSLNERQRLSTPPTPGTSRTPTATIGSAAAGSSVGREPSSPFLPHYSAANTWTSMQTSASVAMDVINKNQCLSSATTTSTAPIRPTATFPSLFSLDNSYDRQQDGAVNLSTSNRIRQLPPVSLSLASSPSSIPYDKANGSSPPTPHSTLKSERKNSFISYSSPSSGYESSFSSIGDKESNNGSKMPSPLTPGLPASATKYFLDFSKRFISEL